MTFLDKTVCVLLLDTTFTSVLVAESLVPGVWAVGSGWAWAGDAWVVDIGVCLVGAGGPWAAVDGGGTWVVGGKGP